MLRKVTGDMPEYTPPEDLAELEVVMLSPAEQARELARKEREAIKAQLTKTMGGGKFEAPPPREERAPREPRGDREQRH